MREGNRTKKRRHDRYKIQNRRRKVENNISIQKKKRKQVYARKVYAWKK